MYMMTITIKKNEWLEVNLSLALLRKRRELLPNQPTENLIVTLLPTQKRPVFRNSRVSFIPLPLNRLY